MSSARRRFLIAGGATLFACALFATSIAFAGCTSHASDAVGDGGVILGTGNYGRPFPSIFAAWENAENVNDIADASETPLALDASATYARHDLLWRNFSSFGLAPGDGLATGETQFFSPSSITKAQTNIQALRGLNPNIRVLAEIRYYDAKTTYLSASSSWWLKDASGNLVPSDDADYFLLDFSQQSLRDEVGHLCQLVMQTGAFDGCFLDHWSASKQQPGGSETDRDQIAASVRAALGDAGLLIVNVNQHLPSPGSAPYVNGLYMEGYGSDFFPISQWQTAAQNMLWAVDGSGNLKSPSFTAFEGWDPQPGAAFSTAGRNDYALVRWTTALSLVFSNGYVLFGDPNGVPGGDHQHDIYVPLWSDSQGSHSLGHPLAPPTPLDRAESDGSFRREFSQGSVILNPPDHGAVTVSFTTSHLSLGSSTNGTTFTIQPGDADVFISAP